MSPIGVAIPANVAAMAAHAQGAGTKALALASHTEGFMTRVAETGNCGHAEGDSTQVNGINGHAEGYQTSANGKHSHAQGHSSIAGGDNSHAEGDSTQALGNHSHAGGFKTIAQGAGSFAGGNESKAFGPNSFSYGTNNETHTQHSAAFGLNNKVLQSDDPENPNYASIAGGWQNTANGSFQTVFGNNNIASKTSSQTVVGQYNAYENNVIDNALFVVGNGKGDALRSNALVVDKDGSVNCLKDLSVDGNIQNGTNSKAYGTNSIASGTDAVAYSKASKSLGYKTQAGSPTTEEQIKERPDAILGIVNNRIDISNPSFVYIGADVTLKIEDSRIYYYCDAPDGEGDPNVTISYDASHVADKTIPFSFDFTCNGGGWGYDLYLYAVFDNGSRTKIWSNADDSYGNYLGAEDFSLSCEIQVPENTVTIQFSLYRLGGDPVYEMTFDNLVIGQKLSNEDDAQAAVAIGTETAAVGKNSLAGGYKSIASGEYSIALGNSANAIGNHSIAIGSENYARGIASVAMGAHNEVTAEADAAAVFGYNNKATGDYVFIAGNLNKTDPTKDTHCAAVFGKNNTAVKTAQFICGEYSKPTEDMQFVVGNGDWGGSDDEATTIRKNAFAVHTNGAIEGGARKEISGAPDNEADWGDINYWRYNEAHGTGSMAMGMGAVAYSRASKSLGYRTQAGYPTSAELAAKRPEALSIGGKIDIANPTSKYTAEYSEVRCESDKIYFIGATDPDGSTSYGYATVEYDAKHLAGKTISISLDWIAGLYEGILEFEIYVRKNDGIMEIAKPSSGETSILTEVSFPADAEALVFSFSTGVYDGSITLNNINISAPYPAENVGQAAFAIGADTIAVGKHSLAGGYKSIAIGDNSLSFGGSNTTKCQYGIALGYGNKVEGNNSTYASVALGRNNTTKATCQIVMGDNNIASNTMVAQTITGQFNKVDDNALFIVGNGQYDSARNNAFVVNKDGTVECETLNCKNLSAETLAMIVEAVKAQL